MKTTSAAATHTGKVRRDNQDAWVIREAEALFAVADGMGGHRGGEVASTIAVDALAEFFGATSSDEDLTWRFRDLGRGDLHASRLLSAIDLGHQRIQATALAHPALAGMGTTVVAAHLAGGRLYLAHVGDSRGYLLRNGRLRLLTSDHSLANQVAADPRFDGVARERVRVLRHVLVRALGIAIYTPADIDLSRRTLHTGDVLLLCSDGVTTELTSYDLGDLLREHDDPADACRAIVDAALAAGGRDNITALVLRVDSLA
ncbi:MAG: serine/threonine-protein phosphatase [Deltaproteobacteria bacterium]|nr:serine/threonine-protein phosphatase [Deltaproteobacteria bacterium]